MYTKDFLSILPFLLEYHLQKDTCVKIALSKYKAKKDKIEYSTYHLKNILFDYHSLLRNFLKNKIIMGQFPHILL